MTRGKNMRAT